MIATRLTPFAPRSTTRSTILSIETYKERLQILEALLNNKKLTCPVCRSSKHVIIVGSRKNGVRKYKCKRCLSRKNVPGRGFSTFTSLEAYQEYLSECLTILTTCGGTYEGIAKYLEISEYMIELAIDTYFKYLMEEPTPTNTIDIKSDYVVIYADFSFTRLSKKISLIMADVGGRTVFKLVPSINSMTAWDFILDLKNTLNIGPKTKVIIVTDGELAWIDPIRKIFPEAIHIRQFHAKNTLGIIYAHFRFQGTEYTFRCRWDLVVKDGICDEKTKKRREMHAKGMKDANNSNNRSNWRDLSNEVILWKGIVKVPRGRKLQLIPNLKINIR
jgi:transcription elongation factor Elf1